MEQCKALTRKYATNDPFQLCKDLKIKVLTMPMEDIRGLFMRLKRRNIIWLDESLDEKERRFVCAHELAHFVLHKHINRTFLDTKTFLKTSTYEKEADLFACCLLYPDSTLDEYEGWTVEQIASFWGVPEDPVRQRLQLQSQY